MHEQNHLSNYARINFTLDSSFIGGRYDGTKLTTPRSVARLPH